MRSTVVVAHPACGSSPRRVPQTRVVCLLRRAFGLILLSTTSVLAISSSGGITSAHAQGGAASAAASAGGADSVSGTGGNGDSDFSSGGSSQYRGGGGGGAGATGGNGGRGYNNPAGPALGGATAGASGADGASGGDAAGNGGGGGAHGFVGTLPSGQSSGGSGGSGGASSGGGGGGGAGGYGAVVSGNGALTGNVTGGNGGNGGSGFTMGSGGSGGIGLLVQGSSNLTVGNGLAIKGGSGGFTQDGSGIFGAGGSGGAGGHAVDVRTSGLVLTNNGSIAGGDGCIGGNGGPGIVGGPPGTGPRYSGSDGAAGIGIIGAGLSVINNGLISGGQGYAGRTAYQANAVTFTGGVNSLTITAGSQISGKVDAYSAADTLGLGGNVDGTFALGQVGVTGSTAQYRGFGVLEKSGTGVWTVNGTGTVPLLYRLTGGVLDLDGATQSATSLLLNGGSLRNGELGTAGPLDLRAGSIAASLSGTGFVSKTTSGTVTLSGTNSYSGTTTVSDGVLEITSSSAIGDGSSSNSLIFDGGTLRAIADVISPDTRAVLMSGLGYIDTNGHTVGLAGNISGAEDLTKLGNGTLTLSGMNAGYSGAIEIAAGTLDVQSDNALGSSAGGTNVASGATLAIGGDISLVGEAISLAGSGVGGAGAVRNLSGDNSHSGQLTLTDDSRINSDAGSLTLSGPIDATLAGRVLMLGGAGSGVVVGAVRAGVGEVVKDGAGIWTLSGDNLYAGSTTISGGILQALGSGSLGDGSSTNVLIFNGGILQAIGDLSSPSTRGVQVQSSGAIDTNGHAVSFDGILTGTGQLTKTGAGILTLAGSNTASQSYSGTLLIEGGTLAINGLFGDLDLIGGLNQAEVRVRSGGVLLGTGRVAGSIFLEGGRLSGALFITGTTDMGAGSVLSGTATVGGDLVLGSGSLVSPGNSPGTITVLGSTTFSAGSTYNVETVAGTTTSDLIAITGSLAITGGDVRHIGLPGTYLPSQTYTIITAAGGVTGQFDSVSSAYLFLTPSLIYNPTSVELKLDRNNTSFTALAATANQFSSAAALDGLDSNNEAKRAVTGLSDVNQVRDAFDQLSGEIYASTLTGLIEDSRFVRDVLNQRMGVQSSAQDGAGSNSYWVDPVWMSGFGSWGTNDGDAATAALDRRSRGLFIGSDGVAPGDVQLGAMAGWSKANYDVNRGVSSAEVESGHIGFYAGTMLSGTQLKAGAAYTHSAVDVARAIAIPGFRDKLSSSFTANTAQIFTEISHSFEAAPSMRLEPFVNLAHVNVDTSGFMESGGDAALASDGGHGDATFTTLGIRGQSQITLNDIDFTLNASLAWRHGFGGNPQQALRFAEADTPFTIAGTSIAGDTALLEVGMSAEVSPNTQLSVTYAGQFGSGLNESSVKAQLGVRF